MKNLDPIRSIDDKEPSSPDVMQIQNSGCLNCRQPYSDIAPVLYVRLERDTKRLLWWHVAQCTKIPRGPRSSLSNPTT